jgi:hypothetical protein
MRDSSEFMGAAPTPRGQSVSQAVKRSSSGSIKESRKQRSSQRQAFAGLRHFRNTPGLNEPIGIVLR